MVHRGPAAAIIVAAAALIAYATSLPGAFQYDDGPTIVDNAAVRDADHLPGYFTDPTLFSGEPGNRMYRPVLLLTYFANHQVSEYQPSVWHLTNILLHALNACLVVVLASRLLWIFGHDRQGVRYAPFLSGLVFALHPVNSEVANYISARSGSIATAGFLGALLLYIAWTRGGHSRTARGALLAGSLALFAVGLGGKEIAVAFVPGVLALELLDPKAGPLRGRVRRGVLRVLPGLLLLAGYLYLRQRLLGVAATNVGSRFLAVPGREDLFWGGGRTIYQNLLTQARVFWMYISLLLLPVGLAVDHFVRVSTSVFETEVLLSLLGLLALAWLVVRVGRRRPLVAFGALLFCFGLAPTSTIVPLNVLMNEHRLYLPGVGFAVLAGTGLSALLRWRPRASVVLFSGLGVCCLVLVTVRNLEWQDRRELWEATLRASPRSFRAHNQVGVFEYRAALRAGLGPQALPSLGRAIDHYEKAEQEYPDWYVIHQNLALAHQFRARILDSDRDFAAAAAHFTWCAERKPAIPELRRDVALIHALWGKYREAHEWYSALAREAGRDPVEYEDELFLEVMRKMPRDPRAHLAYAGLLATRPSPEREKAERYFRRAVALGHEPEEGEFEQLFEQ